MQKWPLSTAVSFLVHKVHYSAPRNWTLFSWTRDCHFHYSNVPHFKIIPVDKNAFSYKFAKTYIMLNLCLKLTSYAYIRVRQRIKVTCFSKGKVSLNVFVRFITPTAKRTPTVCGTLLWIVFRYCIDCPNRMEYLAKRREKESSRNLLLLKCHLPTAFNTSSSSMQFLFRWFDAISHLYKCNCFGS